MRKALVESAKTGGVTGDTSGSVGYFKRTPLRSVISGILRQHRHTALVSSATVLMLGGATAHAQVNPDTGQQGATPGLEEIVVSAQRRSETIQNVPYNISVLGGDALDSAAVVSLNDLTRLVPGLTAVDEGPASRAGFSSLTLRGIRTDSPGGGLTGEAYDGLTVNPISTYFGETPVFFQIPLQDVERVEVLRGPQGTLYGSGAEAGTIRIVPKRPDFDGLSGEIDANGGYTEYAPSGNGSIHGMLNIPIADQLALRVVAGYDYLGGFIKAVDRFVLGADGTPVPSIPGDLTSGPVLAAIDRGVNGSNQWFARGALRWQPNAAIDLQLDYLHQKTTVDDAQWGSPIYNGGRFDDSGDHWPNGTVNLRPGCAYCTTTFVAEPYHDETDLVSLVGTFDLGLATITSASSYYDKKNLTVADGTPGQINVGGTSFIVYYPYNFFPRTTNPQHTYDDDHSFVQELRLVSKQGGRFDYVVGLYYQDQKNYMDVNQFDPGVTEYLAAIGQPSAALPIYDDENYLIDRHTTFTDKAIFGELTLHVTDAWQVTGGTRFFRQSFLLDEVQLIPICGAICSQNLVDPSGRTDFNSNSVVNNHLWKLNSSYDFNATTKLYVTFSEGFRRGGAGGLPTSGPFASLPEYLTFKPEFLKNYEIGMKGTLLDRQLRYFADVYLAEISNFQLNEVSLSGIPGAFNGSDARTQGVELQLDAAPTDRLVLGLGYAYTKAYVRKSLNILDYPPYALVPSLGGTAETSSIFYGAIPAGAKLPGVPQQSITLSGDYTVPEGVLGRNDWVWKFHLDANYRSSEQANISPSSPFNWTIPSAVITNARATLITGRQLSFDAFINNITSNPAYSGSEFVQTIPYPYSLRNVTRPRTIGIGIRYAFGKL
jgi:iron complex outermembrane receptor protein